MAGDHGGNDWKQFFSPFKWIGFIKRPVHTESADDLLAFFDRNADKWALYPPFFLARGRAIQKERFLADFGNGDRISGFNYFTGYAFSELVFNPVHGALSQTVGHLDVNLIAQGVQNCYSALHHIHWIKQNIQHFI